MAFGGAFIGPSINYVNFWQGGESSAIFLEELKSFMLHFFTISTPKINLIST